MLDLPFWVALLNELSPDSPSIAESISSVRASVVHLEKLSFKAKAKLDDLVEDAKAETSEYFECEDSINNLVMRLQAERRRLLSTCVAHTTEELVNITSEIHDERPGLNASKVRRVALFCKRVLKEMNGLAFELPEVDITVFTRLKSACVCVLRLIIAKVLANTREVTRKNSSETAIVKVPKTIIN
jgi:hypothetical protein